MIYSDSNDAETLRQRARDLYLARRLISEEDVEPRSRHSVSLSPSSSELLSAGPSSTVVDDEPLPPGWSLGHTDNGKVFYIDHNTRRTTWVNKFHIYNHYCLWFVAYFVVNVFTG